MSVLVILAATAAFLVSTVELAFRNQRHPFGDLRNKALWWWIVVAATDAAVAVLVNLGFTGAAGLPKSNAQGNPLIAAVLVGVLGPLALRSPIRKKEVAGRETGVGITYVYDVIRLASLRALDERLVRLRRLDVDKRCATWTGAGILPEEVWVAIEAHVEEYQQLEPGAREEILSGVAVCQSFPTDAQQMESLIKLMRQNRLQSLIDEFSARARSVSARRR